MVSGLVRWEVGGWRDQQRYGRRGGGREGGKHRVRDGGEGRTNIWAGRDAGERKLE